MGDRDIRDAINAITDNDATARTHTVEAVVLSVDLNNRVCVCQSLSDKAQRIYNNVRLMATLDDGVLLVPTVGSNVCLIQNDFASPYITQYSGIDKIILMGGDLGGLVKVAPLVAKLNAVENLLNDLVAKFNSHTHILALSSGSGTAAITAAPETGTIAPITKRVDLENTNILTG